VGLRIERDRFEESDYERFSERLAECLEALRRLLERPGFGSGPASLGGEVELFLVDAAARPLPLNLAVLAETVDPRVTVELDRFNLECNLRPALMAGHPFTALERELEDALAEVRRAARAHGGRVALVGILPTLTPGDLQSGAMTDLPRYRALSAGLQRLRRAPFEVHIDGPDPLRVSCNDVTFEGANTSLQVHLRVEPGEFSALYNAVQLATAPALAVACNSPTFLGHRLWEETRVALFKQAVDDRSEPERRRNEARVSFGSAWVAQGALELFADSVARFEPLLPVLGDESPLACVCAGGVPRLDEVRLHQGTVWRWNRAIYDPAAGGHLRIEMRALPSGPTVLDMMANAAFLVGLSLGLAPQVDEWLRDFPFERAHSNFYRAAQLGLAAELAWPRGPGEPPVPTPARELIVSLLPVARRGLAQAGVERAESERLLGVIAARAETGRTGARWQALTLASCEARGAGRGAALAEMLARYLERSESGNPVHTWTGGS
jgi:hypothetical protein